jgi:hypothetical protein
MKGRSDLLEHLFVILNAIAEKTEASIGERIQRMTVDFNQELSRIFHSAVSRLLCTFLVWAFDAGRRGPRKAVHGKVCLV